MFETKAAAKEEKAQQTHQDFKTVLASQRPGAGKFEVGEVSWWAHPDPKFQEYSREVIVAGDEIADCDQQPSPGGGHRVAFLS